MVALKLFRGQGSEEIWRNEIRHLDALKHEEGVIRLLGRLREEEVESHWHGAFTRGLMFPLYAYNLEKYIKEHHSSDPIPMSTDVFHSTISPVIKALAPVILPIKRTYYSGLATNLFFSLLLVRNQ